MWKPAAFGRLCVETMVKRMHPLQRAAPAAFGRLCVETVTDAFYFWVRIQPPSGGCVLKPNRMLRSSLTPIPAAFGRLCVETKISRRCRHLLRTQPPSGGCVLKLVDCEEEHEVNNSRQPPSGGCVLKPSPDGRCRYSRAASRLRAAVC